MNNDNNYKINNGKVWFGNKSFYYSFEEISDKKEEIVKFNFFKKVYEQIRDKIDNPILFLSKFIPIIDANLKINKNNKDWFSLKNKSISEESKFHFLKHIVDNYEYKDSNIVKSYLKKIVDGLKTQDYKLKEIYNNYISVRYPLICGLGATHVLETSLTLHHIWGVPYIPGSSFKGVCRQVAFWKLAESRNITKEEELQNLQNKFYGNLIDDKEILSYQLLFGAKDFKGLLLFLDVYPDFSDEKSKKPFKLDIMNPHYSKYYGDDSGKTVPGDWDNPVPIYFLTVKPGVKFKFVILFDNYRWERVEKYGLEITKDNKKVRIDVPEKAKEKISTLKNGSNKFFEDILEEALSNYGLGSKTRLGYGSFEV